MAKSVAENIKKFRDQYELGCNASPSERAAYGTGVVQKLAAKKKLGHGTAYRARQFAKMFTRSELNDLCKLRCGNGNSLTWGHVTKVLSIQDETQRWNLLKKAAKHNWSVRDLEREVAKASGEKRNYGGGKFKLNDDPVSLTQEIQSHSRTWLRFNEQLRSDDDPDKYVDALPDSLRQPLREVEAAMEALNKKAASLGKRAASKKKKKK